MAQEETLREVVELHINRPKPHYISENICSISMQVYNKYILFKVYLDNESSGIEEIGQIKINYSSYAWSLSTITAAAWDIFRYAINSRYYKQTEIYSPKLEILFKEVKFSGALCYDIIEFLGLKK